MKTANGPTDEKLFPKPNSPDSTLFAMSFCAISGEPPLEPVLSNKSGKIYERRLIVKYINENGTDPTTGDKLDESDLIPINACKFV